MSETERSVSPAMNLEAAESRWFMTNSTQTLWEWLESCCHWNTEKPIEVSDAAFPTGKLAVGDCFDCGQHFDEPFAMLVEKRRKTYKQHRKCVLNGFEDEYKRACDCKVCNAYNSY